MLGVALVGVLTAIALPAYNGWRTKTLSRQAAQEIEVMSVVIKQFQEDARVYPPDLAAVGLNTKLDPWGRAYQYLPAPVHGHGGVRKDRALNPINTDFDLYSVGPDGDTQVQLDNRVSLDDVIRARDGGFIGVAADF